MTDNHLYITYLDEQSIKLSQIMQNMLGNDYAYIILNNLVSELDLFTLYVFR